jgi:Na+-transporting NADH:ubiquinone oxidoreductase subunit NqrC
MSYKNGYDSEDEKQSESKSSSLQESKIAESKSSNNGCESDIVEKVQEFFFGNDELAYTFENFIKKRSKVVDLHSEEYKLEYTEIFEEYKQMFEEAMESFITKTLKSSIQKFYSAMKIKIDEDVNSNESIFSQILLAVTDFDVFMTMMKEAARATTAEEKKVYK